jgi:hypothetical protein
MRYLDALVDGQILPGAQTLTNKDNVKAVYDDWRRRLVHPQFGLSSFFITQNGPAKGGIRWGPTVVDLVQQKIPLQVSLAFANAVLLRWLTPVRDEVCDGNYNSALYTGWLESSCDKKPTLKEKSYEGAVTYADGLRYHLEQGWHEYKCPLVGGCNTPLVKLLQKGVGELPTGCVPIIREYLVTSSGGNLPLAQTVKLLSCSLKKLDYSSAR